MGVILQGNVGDEWWIWFLVVPLLWILVWVIIIAVFWAIGANYWRVRDVLARLGDLELTLRSTNRQLAAATSWIAVGSLKGLEDPTLGHCPACFGAVSRGQYKCPSCGQSVYWERPAEAAAVAPPQSPANAEQRPASLHRSQIWEMPEVQRRLRMAFGWACILVGSVLTPWGALWIALRPTNTNEHGGAWTLIVAGLVLAGVGLLFLRKRTGVIPA